MRPAERGFLLLTSHLGDPDRRALTVPQFRTLVLRMGQAERSVADRELEERDLTTLGYRPDMARRILGLLAEEERLDIYLRRGERLGCVPITRINEAYPLRLRQRLGLDSPGCLWARGDLSLLNTPAVALVGSRNILEPNREFAVEVGRQAAIQGYTLVSGNARGADRTGQEACLEAGGSVISILADPLTEHSAKSNILYLSEDGYGEPFSAQRALSRNRCIHALGEKTFVAQSSLRQGGTWDGTVKNLRFHWSGVYCFRDGSEAAELLARMGANPVNVPDLKDFSQLSGEEWNFLDQ